MINYVIKISFKTQKNTNIDSVYQIFKRYERSQFSFYLNFSFIYTQIKFSDYIQLHSIFSMKFKIWKIFKFTQCPYTCNMQLLQFSNRLNYFPVYGALALEISIRNRYRIQINPHINHEYCVQNALNVRRKKQPRLKGKMEKIK